MTATDANLAPIYWEISDWLNRSAFKDWTIPQLQEQLVKLLAGFGVEVQRMHIGVPVLHPLHTVGTYNWHCDRGTEVQNFNRGFTKTDAWLNSPIRPVFESGKVDGRIRISPGSHSDRFPFLRSAGEDGATDYFVQLTNFKDRSIPPEGQNGVVLTWISSAPGGFTEESLELLRMIRLPLCAQLRGLTHRSLTRVVLDAYIGPYSSQRVYDGQIQRGDGEMIDAVILFCDLRGSSKLAERYDVQRYLTLLNEYFETTAGAFIEAGGEVLKYIGDASLTIFPTERYSDRTTACTTALEAAKQATLRAQRLNRQRKEKGELPIKFGIGLHIGNVMYGNIGTKERIDFTVIGRAANEAARIQDKCKELKQEILVSETFASNLNREWTSQGTFELRNIERPMEVYSPGDWF